MREVLGISTEAPIHMLYGTQNEEFNTLFNEAMSLFQVLNPTSVGKWKTQSDNYKSDYIRMRYNQQIWIAIVIIIFIIMLTALFLLLYRNKLAHKNTKSLLTDVQEKSQIIMSSIDYASKIQRNLLPKDTVFEKAFSDFSAIWKPRDTVGGDIYWAKSFAEYTVLCVCDCTGHGTPGHSLQYL